MDLLFGVETEYALSGVSATAAHLKQGRVVDDFMNIASSELPHLTGRRGHDLFLQNGSRLYIDCGLHPELATPECLDPWDLVRYVRAGDRIVSRLAARVAEQHRPSRVMAFRGNVDYSGMQTTWGCHESYLMRAPMTITREMRLVPHLVSRVIYTGAGGFNPLSPGLQFTLSPRAAFMTAIRSRESTGQRGLLHCRDESLAARPYDRLHVIFGESLSSDRALWLKVGATALVVAMIDAGLRFDDHIPLREPLVALKVFAEDSTCRARVPLKNGRMVSAIDVQRELLAQVESVRKSEYMPLWADEVCARWGEMLDRLEHTPESVSTCLDWAIKRALYADHARRRGSSWQWLQAWTNSLANRESTASADQTAVFQKVRQELFEIDTRFGLLDEDGIFARLEKAGVLCHRVPTVDEAAIERAVVQAPLGSRARLRGEAVRRLADQPGRYLCNWTGVWDQDSNQVLNLNDPFTTRDQWDYVGQFRGAALV